MELPEFLEAAGYRRIALRMSEVGHFHARASIRGREVSVLVDTGAGATLVSLALAQDLGLELDMREDKGASAGNAAIDMYEVRGASLDFAELRIRPRCLLAMDLSQANAAMAAQGVEPIEAILGLDVFDEHGAVIDYGSSSLFLKP